MAVWGLYGDLQNFALLEFIGNHSKEDNCHKFSITSIFKSLGYVIAPILAGFLMTTIIKSLPFVLASISILISFLFYLILVKISQKDPAANTGQNIQINVFNEFHLWKKIGHLLFPVLFLNTLMFVLDGVFWTIGPLFSKSFSSFKDF